MFSTELFFVAQIYTIDYRYAIPLSIVNPLIKGAEFIAQEHIKINPDQPLVYHWKGHGLKLHIPAGAVGEEIGPVTLCIQASLGGDYQMPDNLKLVSGVYWLSVQPPVKRFNKKATVTIQHCASDNDSALSFITAKCTQKSLPYTFKPVPGGAFSESRYGVVQVDHFSALAICGEENYFYALCTYYIPKMPPVHEVHITVTPDLEERLNAVTKRYEDDEEGPTLSVCINADEVSLDVKPDVGIPEEEWYKDGWELTPLVPAKV
jgi:hypothetical protein